MAAALFWRSVREILMSAARGEAADRRRRAKDAIDPKQTETLEEPGLFEIGEQSLPLRQSAVVDVWISGSMTHIIGLPEWESSNERTSRTEEL
jgi:hypothetical protein